MAWRAMDPLAAISDDSDDSEEESDGVSGEEKEEEEEERVEKKTKKKSEENKSLKHGSAVAASQRKGVREVRKGDVDFEALSRHGYSGGPSVLHVPAPKQEAGDPNWSWSNGKRKIEGQEQEESLEERQRTREMANENATKIATEALAESAYAKKQRREAAAEQKALSFSQKEKRKRDFGQASRGKNYVEEEKRLLRDSGVYSGFDT